MKKVIPDWQLKVKELMRKLTVCVSVEEENRILRKIIQVQKNKDKNE